MKQCKNTTGIGVDVSKSQLTIAWKTAEKEITRNIPNTEEALLLLTKELSGYTGKIVMESTGRYHLVAAFTLQECGLDVRVINPLLAKKYQVSNIRKVKSDPADAKMLAQMAEREEHLPLPFKATAEEIMFRQKLGYLASLETEIQALEASHKSFEEINESLKQPMSPAVEAIRLSIQAFKKSREQLLREIEKWSQKQQKGTVQYDLLTSIPGVSPFVAAIFSSFFDTRYDSAKQWIAYAGLDISVRQSGTWKGRGKLTKRGHSYVRKRLFSAAWGAAMNNPHFKLYYENMKTAGRSHKESLLVIARKIIRIAFSVLSSHRPYDPSFAFSS